MIRIASGVRAHATGGLLWAALVMALLGVIGFILMSWMMMGEVHWVMYHSGPGMPF